MPSFSLEQKAPWSNSALDRLGKKIAQADPFDIKALEEFRYWMGNFYRDAIVVLEEEAAKLARPAQDVWSPLVINGSYEVAGRVKTLSTLRDKLQRRGANLSRIRDVAGTRLDFDGGPQVQDVLAEMLSQRMEAAGATAVNIIDRRKEPIAGYRAVHLEVRSPRGYLEIQLRTRVQSEWANTYETFGDVVGRDIRYSDTMQLNPSMAEVKRNLLRLSESWDMAERAYDEARSEMISWSEVMGKAGVEQRLDILAVSSQQVFHNLKFIRDDFPAERSTIVGTLKSIRSKLEALRKEPK